MTFFVVVLLLLLLVSNVVWLVRYRELVRYARRQAVLRHPSFSRGSVEDWD